MEAFLLCLLSLTIGGSVIAGALLLLPRIPNKLPKSVFYYAWLLVLLRLILPLPGKMELPRPQQAPPAVAVQEELPRETQSQAEAAPSFEAKAAQPIPVNPNRISSPEELWPLPPKYQFSIWDGLAIVWALGFLLFLGRDLIGYFRFRHALKKSSLPPTAEDLAVYCPLAGKRRPRLRRCRAVDTPMLMGLFRPTLLLPDREYSAETLGCIFIHELTHYRRGDIAYKWFAMPVLAVHWFNPMTILIRREIDRCCELSCDERLLKAMDHDQRRSYGQTLLVLAARSSPAKTSLSTSFATEKKNLKERLVQIMNFSPKSKWVIGTAAVLLVAVAVCCILFGPASKPTVEGDALVVKNVNQLLSVIGPDTKIILKPGKYDLTKARTYGKTNVSQYYHWEECVDGYQLVITDADNLSISGRDREKCEIVTRPRYAAVLNFRDCDNLNLTTLTAGHTEGPGGCVGSVIAIGSGTQTNIDNCVLYGCGTYGVEADQCVNLQVTNSDIKECSLGGVIFGHCIGAQIRSCRVFNCGSQEYPAYHMFSFLQCQDSAVVNCQITGNYADILFETRACRNIQYLGSTVDNPQGITTAFYMENASPVVDGCSFSLGNKFHWFDNTDECYVLSPEGKQLGTEDLAAMTAQECAFVIPPETEAPEIQAPADGTPINVSTVDEFLAAIRPGAVIQLAEGTYDLSTASEYGFGFNNYYAWQETYDGYFLEIRNVDDLQIIGAGKDKTTIAAIPRYADVLAFTDCTGITLKNFTAGHTEEPGACSGGVLYFDQCQNGVIEGCGLYGCGTIGIHANVSSDFTVTDTEIYDCSQAGLDLRTCQNFAFENCDFHDLPQKIGSLNGSTNITENGEPISE